MRCHSVACGMASRMQISNAIDCAKFYSRSHDAVIRVYNQAGNVIEMHEHAGEFGVTDYSELFCGGAGLVNSMKLAARA
jgi:hypothetical protein